MINYGIIQDSINYYESEGFQRIETPWMVSSYSDSLTRPANVKPFVVELNKKGSRLAFDYIDCTFEADHLNFTAPSERKDEWFDTVMAMHRDGASVRGIAKETGVPKSTVGRWVNNNGSQLQDSI